MNKKLDFLPQNTEPQTQHRQSLSSVSWASSTLTTSSHENISELDDDGNWCAQKMRKQRYKMEKLVICYEQQSKCIAELEEYIDELERTNSMKDQQIERLKGSKEREMELELQESIYQKEATRDQLEEKNRMLSLVNGQLRFYELERQRWEKALDEKEKEILEEREAHEQAMQTSKKVYESKLIKNQTKWMNVQQHLNETISRLEKENSQLKERLKDLQSTVEKRNEFEQMLQLRRQLSERQDSFNCNNQKREAELQMLKEDIEKYKNELRKMKKENCKLRNQLQTKQFDQEIDKKLVATSETHREKTLKLSLEEKTKSNERLTEELRKLTKEVYDSQSKLQAYERKIHLLESEMKGLRNQCSSKAERQRKIEGLRNLEHEQIQSMNRLFRKMDML